MARILIIEDEIDLAKALRRGLLDEQHVVQMEHDGEAGLFCAEHDVFDLVILDLMLPKLTGLEVCRRLRAQRNDVPVLVLTAKDTDADIVVGLDAGADDYVVKPFAFDVLIARVRSLLRRAVGQTATRYRAGPLELDATAKRAFVDGAELRLTATEWRLLEVLVRRQGAVLSKERLLDAAWDRDAEPTSNVVEVHIASLRKKVDAATASRLIHTVRGIGYVLRLDEPAG